MTDDKRLADEKRNYPRWSARRRKRLEGGESLRVLHVEIGSSHKEHLEVMARELGITFAELTEKLIDRVWRKRQRRRELEEREAA